jgi:hypothetical protein
MRGRVALAWEENWIPEPNTGCFLWLCKRTEKGYGLLNRKMKMQLAHRHAWELAYGPIPAGKWVLHKCDTPGCVNPEHLFLGTAQDNFDDMLAKERWAPAARRLRECEVEEIRRLGSSVTQELLGRMFRVSQGHISNILSGRTRKRAWRDKP